MVRDLAAQGNSCGRGDDGRSFGREARVDPEQMQATLARNDLYLHRFVEAFDVCPFARTCRERGRLFRRVLPGQGDVLATSVG
jgi:hypothetical protein